MVTHSKSDLAVSALLQNLNEELDRRNRKKIEDLMLAKMQRSVHGRLGPRISKQDSQISYCRGGGELCGAIFMCNRRTWKECLGQCLFGLPIGKKVLVEQVIPGMRLFLFEYERRQLWGVFEAVSYGEMDIIPDAYSGGSFPCQVRVKVPEECVALYEEEFRDAIKHNYYSDGKFHFDLSEKQVCHLTSLFERKYLSASVMHSNLLEYEDKQYISNGCKPSRGLPLMLTNDVTFGYPKESLQHCWNSPSCQVANGAFLFSADEEGMDPFLKKTGSRIGCEAGSLVPFSNGALETVQNTVTSLTGELGNGFDILNTSNLTFYGSNECSIVEDTATGDMIISPNNVPLLHSDRPTTKSVWARISGRSKFSVNSESAQTKRSPTVTPVLTSHLDACKISELDVVDDSLVHDLLRADVGEEAVEEFSVGFKRRRAGSNSASAVNHESATKQRRKITRPSFDADADEDLVEQGTVETNALPSANGSLSSSLDCARVDEGDTSTLAKLPIGLEVKVCSSRDMSCSTALDIGEATVSMNALGGNQGHGILQAVQDFCKASTLDLNVPVEVSNENEQEEKGDEGIPNVTGFLDTEEEGSDLQQGHVSAECTSLDLNTTRASTFSLAPCTPAKDFLDRLHSCSEQSDDGKGLSDLEQDMPLRLELGNGVQLPDAELQRDECVVVTSCNKESAMLDESANGNQVKESNTILLHCAPGSNLLNQVDLKSFLNGIQVSGIKLQLGESPCLILQLGDTPGSTSNVGSQDQRGAAQGPL